LPDDIAPADLTLDKALELVRAKAEGPRSLGVDPATGMNVYVMNGRYGAYVQLGETPEGKKARSRSALAAVGHDGADGHARRGIEAALAAS
jgi:DNA topoisomerase-1